MANNIIDSIDLNVFFSSRRKCAALLLIDVSQSMKSYADSMSRGVEEMFTAISSDDACLDTMEVGVMTFNKTAKLIRPISALDPAENYRFDFDCKGRTSIGTAVLTALDEIQKRIDYYHEESDDEPYVPKLVIITDAKPLPPDEQTADEQARLEQAYAELQDMIANKELCVLPVGVGERLDKDNLYHLSGGSIGKGYFTIEAEMDEIKKLFKAIGTSMSTAAVTGDLLSSQSFQDQLDDPDSEEDVDDSDDCTAPGDYDCYEDLDDCPLIR